MTIKTLASFSPERAGLRRAERGAGQAHFDATLTINKHERGRWYVRPADVGTAFKVLSKRFGDPVIPEAYPSAKYSGQLV